MSQKPRTGAQGGSASDDKGAAKQPASRTATAKAEGVRPPAVRAEPVAKAAPVIPPEFAIKAEPIVKAEPVVKTPVESPVATAIPVRQPTRIAQPEAAIPAVAATESITATADHVAAVAAKAIPMAKAVEPTKTTLTQGMKTMMKSTEDLVAFGQANLEAFVKSGQIWSAGVQELTKQIATSAKASFEESVSTFKAISTAKSVKEAIDLQSTFAKSALEKAMAESNKLTDASIKLTEQTLAPITARVTVAVETFGKTH
jgi:phasin family protein